MEHYVEIFSDNWLSCCSLCPRMCRADRRVATGFCGCGVDIQAARAAISGKSLVSAESAAAVPSFSLDARCAAVFVKIMPSAENLQAKF